MMKVKLKERTPMFQERLGTTEPIWFEAGEEFDVISTKLIQYDNKEWYRLKNKWFQKPLEGLHNPDGFEIISL